MKEITKTKEYLEHLASFPRLNPNPIIEANSSGRVTFHNTAAIEVLKKLGIKKDVNIFFPNDMNEILKALEQEKKAQFYREVEIKDIIFGENIYLEPRFNSVRIYASDITERKRAEEAIKKYEAQLKESNRLKDLFMDIMYHDLLNPVGIIKNFVELLAADESSKNMQEEIRVLHRNARKLEEIIESVSKLAKVESMEKMEFQKQDLNVILREVIQSFEQYLVEKGMQVEYESEGEYPAKANPIIEEVFSNLLSNAIKYSPEKSRIVIGIEDDGKNWKVGVKDYGVGVPDEFKETIFERFKRVDSRGVKGTGLGLAIVKRLVEMHNGKVWVEDNPDGGSIFYVALPKLKLC